MYGQWLKVYASNRALNGEIHVLRDFNEKAIGKISKLETLLAEKSEALKAVTSKLERTQKSLRLLNNGSRKLDHLITTVKSFGNHSGIGYKGETSSSKIVFINFGLLDDFLNVLVKKPAVKSVATKQSIATDKSVSDVR